MAVRERKGRASPWQCYWNNPLTGKRECANFATRQEAEKHDSLIKHRIKFERESFQGEEKEEQESELTLEACYLQYLKQKQFSKKDLKSHLSSMRPALIAFGQEAIGGISRKMLIALMEKQRSITSLATLHKRMSNLRTVLRWCAEQGYREIVDFPRIPNANYTKLIPPSPEELEAMMQHAAPHIVRAIILGAQCGVRVGASEMFVLQWEDVDLQRAVLRVHGAKKNVNAPWRDVPIRKSLMPVFAQWKKEDEEKGIPYLIHFKGHPVQKIGKAWHETLRRAGITRRIRPYDLRHAFATELIAFGTDIGTVAKLMGHSGPEMLLKHYQYVMDTQKRAAIEALPELGICAQNYVPKRKGTYGIGVSA